MYMQHTHVQAFNMGLTTDNHVWMFPAWYESNWWMMDLEDINCTADNVSYGTRRVHVRVEFTFPFIRVRYFHLQE